MIDQRSVAVTAVETGPKQMKRVFLSSSVGGLTQSRTAAAAAIDAIDGYQCLRMEDFGARTNPPIKMCLEELRKCQVYIGIVGQLYGSSPPGEQKSFTQLEFEEAGRLGLPRLVFLTSEEFPVPGHLIEGDDRRLRQREFRELVSKEIARAVFSSDAELRAKVAEALANLPNNACGQRVGRDRTILLFPYVTNQVGFDTGIAIVNTGAAPFDRAGRTGPCKLFYYGRTSSGLGKRGDFGPDHFAAGALTPINQPSEPLSPGDQLLFTLSRGGGSVTSTPGFQGYIIAACEFPHARGFAFISDGPIGEARLAASYLAEVLKDSESPQSEKKEDGVEAPQGAS